MKPVQDLLPIVLVSGLLVVLASGMEHIGRAPSDADAQPGVHTALVRGAQAAGPPPVFVLDSVSHPRASPVDALLERLQGDEQTIRDPQTSTDEMVDAFEDRDAAVCMLRDAVSSVPEGARPARAGAYLALHTADYVCSSASGMPGVRVVQAPDRRVP